MEETDFIPQKNEYSFQNGSISAEAPSNIALIKYWGKFGEQLPKNPSLSMTLNHCKTTTVLDFEKKSALEIAKADFDFEIYLDHEKAEAFRPKIQQFFERALPYLPFLTSYKFTIKTTNSFPHSSGIASSASGMAALALCLTGLEKKLDKGKSDSFYTKKASFLARLGSGSACRSIEGGFVVWGKHPEIKNSSNLYGTKYSEEIHEIFEHYQDVILLVDEGEKQVGSSAGHNLMHGHAFAEERFRQAEKNLSNLKSVLKNGDLKSFINIVESEALALHAMMMTSQPYYILMKPNTLQIIDKIWQFRKETGSAICFTLDAGANVHVLFPKSEKEKVAAFIKNELAQFCQDGKCIADLVGTGAFFS